MMWPGLPLYGSRRGLLTEGSVNGVLNAYSALTCWEKSGAEEVLNGTPSQEEFAGLITLIEGLLDERPVAGISQLANAEAVLLRALDLAPNYTLTVEDYSTILDIRQWAEDDENTLSTIAKSCDRVLHATVCTGVIETAVQKGDGLRLAEELGIPFRGDLLRCLQEDFDAHYFDVRYLLDDPAYVEPVFELYRKRLPLEEMKGEPLDDPCMGPEYETYDMLQYLIQELDDKPLVGQDFVKAALGSPVTRNRYRALAVLQEWVQAKNTPLAVLAPELYEEVRLLQDREINEGNLKMIVLLLDGRTQFEDHDYESEE